MHLLLTESHQLAVVHAHFAGIVREKVGDVLIQGESGAQILVDPELMEHFLTCLTQVRGQSQHHTLIQTFQQPQTRFLLVVRNRESGLPYHCDL